MKTTRSLPGDPQGALVDDQGLAVVLGALIKRGGEGTVYQVQGRPDQVAKIYHPEAPPSSSKLGKLSALTRTVPNGSLRAVTAWPTSLIRDTRQRPVGMLM